LHSPDHSLMKGAVAMSDDGVIKRRRSATLPAGVVNPRRERRVARSPSQERSRNINTPQQQGLETQKTSDLDPQDVIQGVEGEVKSFDLSKFRAVFNGYKKQRGLDDNPTGYEEQLPSPPDPEQLVKKSKKRKTEQKDVLGDALSQQNSSPQQKSLNDSEKSSKRPTDYISSKATAHQAGDAKQELSSDIMDIIESLPKSEHSSKISPQTKIKLKQDLHDLAEKFHKRTIQGQRKGSLSLLHSNTQKNSDASDIQKAPIVSLGSRKIAHRQATRSVQAIQSGAKILINPFCRLTARQMEAAQRVAESIPLNPLRSNPILAMAF
jgi:hypothetical protein